MEATMNFLAEYGIVVEVADAEVMFLGTTVPSYSETNQRAYGEWGTEIVPTWGNNDIGLGHACAYVPKSHALVRTADGVVQVFHLQPRYEVRSGRDTLVGWNPAVLVPLAELPLGKSAQRQIRQWACRHEDVYPDSWQEVWCRDCEARDPSRPPRAR